MFYESFLCERQIDEYTPQYFDEQIPEEYDDWMKWCAEGID
jgi:hypothetical protein